MVNKFADCFHYEDTPVPVVPAKPSRPSLAVADPATPSGR